MTGKKALTPLAQGLPKTSCSDPWLKSCWSPDLKDLIPPPLQNSRNISYSFSLLARLMIVNMGKVPRWWGKVASIWKGGVFVPLFFENICFCFFHWKMALCIFIENNWKNCPLDFEKNIPHLVSMNWHHWLGMLVYLLGHK